MRPATARERAAVAECLRSGWLTMGPRTLALEETFASWAGVPHVVAAGSGSAALHLALLGLRVGAGDEVVVPAYAPPAVAEAPRWCGARTVFADVVSAASPVLDAAAVEITPRTRAVVVVHPYGHRAPVADLAVPVVEVGALLGGLTGDAAVADLGDWVGQGGVVLARDEGVAARARSLRAHALTSGTWDRHRGHAAGYDVVDIGFNFRIDEMRAALATERLQTARPELAGAVEAAARADVPGERAAGVLFADRPARDAAAASLAARGLRCETPAALVDLPRAREAGDRLLWVEPGALDDRLPDRAADARSRQAPGLR